MVTKAFVALICTAAAACMLGLPAAAQATDLRPARPAQTSATDAARIFDALVESEKLPFAAVLVFDKSAILFQRATPGFEPARPIAVASASKWVAAALIMTAVDRGELSLDDTVGRWVPEATPAQKSVTLRQLLSHTSGIGSGALIKMGKVRTLEESALRVLAAPMIASPQTLFAYGGGSFQVAGLVLERATRTPFQVLFEQRIGIPLGMRGAVFGSPRNWGTANVPWVGGGLTISMTDYARFLRLVLDDGVFAGQRVLSSNSIRALETNLIADIANRRTTIGMTGQWGYGVGVWCEHLDAAGNCVLVTSPGAFGTYPWLDRNLGQVGLLVTRGKLRATMPAARALRDTLHQ